MNVSGVLNNYKATMLASVVAYPMSGGRFGIAILWGSLPGSPRTVAIPRIAAPDAAALFPGMIAAGRQYADLVVSEIEGGSHAG